MKSRVLFSLAVYDGAVRQTLTWLGFGAVFAAVIWISVNA
jgi:hypothetical protein